MTEWSLDVLVDVVTLTLYEHDSDRMVCMDHDGCCCPALDAHGMTSSNARRHIAQRAVEAVLDLIAKGDDAE